MANIFDIPILAPIRFFKQSDITLNISSALFGTFNPSYNSRTFDADFYQRILQDYEDEGTFIQPFQTCDVIRFNFIGSDTTASNYVCRILDCNGRAYPLSSSTVAQNNSTAITGGKLYDYRIPLYNYPEGKYFIQIQHIQTGEDVYMISEPFHVKEFHDNTIRIDYWNSFNDQGVMFTTDSIKFQLRVPGAVRELTTGSKFFVYEDQPLNLEMIAGKPYRSFRLNIGAMQYPVAEYIADKVERALICDSVMIDGKYYTREEGSKLEKQEVKNNPLAYYGINMRERYNESSIEVQDVETVVLGDMPQTESFYVKEITLATTTYSVQKMFTGKTNFLAYLNSTSFTSSILTDGFFAEDSNSKLVFNKYTDFTISGTWELASNDVLLYGLKVGIDANFGTSFECTLTGTGNFAVISGASGKYITTQNFTAYIGSQSIVPTYTAGKQYEFWVFLDSGCTGIDLNAADPVAYLIGGELPVNCEYINAASTNVTKVEQGLFAQTISGAITSIDISGCKLSTHEINRATVQIYAATNTGAFDGTCVIDLSGQTPSAPPDSGENMQYLIGYISGQISNFATD